MINALPFLLVLLAISWVVNYFTRRPPTEKMVRLAHTVARERNIAPPHRIGDFDAVRDWLDEHSHYIGPRSQAFIRQAWIQAAFIVLSIVFVAYQHGPAWGSGVILWWVLFVLRTSSSAGVFLGLHLVSIGAGVWFALGPLTSGAKNLQAWAASMVTSRSFTYAITAAAVVGLAGIVWAVADKLDAPVQRFIRHLSQHGVRITFRAYLDRFFDLTR